MQVQGNVNEGLKVWKIQNKSNIFKSVHYYSFYPSAMDLFLVNI